MGRMQEGILYQDLQRAIAYMYEPGVASVQIVEVALKRFQVFAPHLPYAL
jgi:hypothetical protein